MVASKKDAAFPSNFSKPTTGSNTIKQSYKLNLYMKKTYRTVRYFRYYSAVVSVIPDYYIALYCAFSERANCGANDVRTSFYDYRVR